MVSRGKRSMAMRTMALLTIATLAATTADTAVPESGELRERSRQLCAALTAGDVQAQYQLKTPEFRSCNSLEKFSREVTASGDGRVTACRSGAPKASDLGRGNVLASQCSDQPLVTESTATVRMKFTLVFPDGSTDRVDDIVNGWVRIGGEWYWYDWASPSIH